MSATKKSPIEMDTYVFISRNASVTNGWYGTVATVKGNEASVSNGPAIYRPRKVTTRQLLQYFNGAEMGRCIDKCKTHTISLSDLIKEVCPRKPKPHRSQQ
jgi:hypothetical protein